LSKLQKQPKRHTPPPKKPRQVSRNECKASALGFQLLFTSFHVPYTTLRYPNAFCPRRHALCYFASINSWTISKTGGFNVRHLGSMALS
jgi:hypothetical protein